MLMTRKLKEGMKKPSEKKKGVPQKMRDSSLLNGGRRLGGTKT